MKNTTPKNVILQTGALITLYISITSVLILIFNVTNLKFPDELSYYWENNGARDAVRNSIAMLVVFFPAFLIFTRLSNQDRRQYAQGEYGTLARWFVYITILGGILILLGDLVTLINYFLNGEISERFLIKVFSLLIVVGIALHYYILDVRGYFKKRVDKAIYFAMGAIMLVIVSIIYGFSYIETPSEVREMRLDEHQISDLREIYWNIQNAYHTTQTLPDNIDTLYINQKKPKAPEDRSEYTYTILDDHTFELCAEFKSESTQYERSVIDMKTITPDEGDPFYQDNNWEHGVGYICFKRTVQLDKPLPL